MTSKNIIITKTGDKGTSKLFSGETVSKNSKRLHAYGEVDELITTLGLARFNAQNESIQNDLLELQRDLFILGGELATTADKLKQLPKRVDKALLDKYEGKIDVLYKKTPIPTDFVVPGHHLAGAYLDQARAVSRRAERHIVELSDNNEINNPELLIFVNRLSDYLYLMARFEEKQSTSAKQ